MIPLTQIVSHCPPLRWGDCWRTCIAMILELQVEEVPHFLHDGLSNRIAQDRARLWLADRGLGLISFNIHSDTNPEHTEMMFGDSHYILSGRSINFKEAWHSVVAKGHFEMIYDPSPLRNGVAPKPDYDGVYMVEFIVRR